MLLPRPKSPAEHAAWAAVYFSYGLIYLAVDHLFHELNDFLFIDLAVLALGVRHIIAALVQIIRWPPDS